MEWKFFIKVLIALFLILTTIFFLAEKFWGPKHHIDEPLLIPQRIPYIGHVAGLFLHGMDYFESMSARCKAPIYTLNTLSTKLYVVTGAELVVAVSRNSKSLSFNPFISEIGVRLTRPEQKTIDIINDNLNGELGSWGYVSEIHDLTVSALGPGKELDSMTHAMLARIAEHLQSSEAEFAQGPIKLHAWCRHLFTMCSTKALYGPCNPFDSQPELEEAFWDFDDDFNRLLVNIAPALIARKGHKGRRKIGQAFKRFFESDFKGRSSAFAEARHASAFKYGISSSDIGQLEVGSLIGILVNTVPAVLYMLYHIFSDKTLLEDIRAELTNSISISAPETARPNQKTIKLHLPTLKEKSPLLQSVFQEVLRFYSRGASSRLVMEDTRLNNQYLLKKGSILMMPTSVIHSDSASWGPNTEFQPRRFTSPLKKNHDNDDNNSNGINHTNPKRNPAASSYRPFGGGATLCPGRHFASAEILAVTAMMVYSYEIEPASSFTSVSVSISAVKNKPRAGKSATEWQWPRLAPPHQTSLATNIFPPRTDIEVRVRGREGWRGRVGKVLGMREGVGEGKVLLGGEEDTEGMQGDKWKWEFVME